MLHSYHLLFATGSFFLGGWPFVPRAPKVLQNVMVSLDVLPLVTSLGVSVAYLKTTRNMIQQRDGSITFSDAIETLINPPLLLSLDSASYTANTDNTITITGCGIQQGTGASINSLVVNPTDTVVTNGAFDDTAAIKYYANQLTPGTYNIVVTNPDGGMGLIMVTLT